MKNGCDMTLVLDVTNLSVELPQSSDRQYAVEDISFSLGAGEIVCVVGESGSGKSVTAQTVMGLLPRELRAVRGQTLLQEEDTLLADPKRLRDLRGTRMAMIFQEPMTALNPVARVGEQIAEVLEIHTDLSAIERRKKAIEIMEAVHLPDPQKMVDSYPHQLSGGQRQRIMIAMALVLDPALLIADEPTTALDVTTQAQILKLIKEMQERRHRRFIHYPDFGVVAEIADRVVVMKHGRIVEQGAAMRRFKIQKKNTRRCHGPVPSMTLQSVSVQGEKALDVAGLNKVYGRKGLFSNDRIVHAAKDVTLLIRKGETLGIVGESGSGKSTVARCIARLIEPTSGTIHLEGLEIGTISQSKLRPHRKHVQIVFQDPYRSLNPRRKIGLSLIEAPVNFGMTKEQAIKEAGDLMTLVGLSPDALDRYPHQFSGGQRQRICIARALAVRPEVLIADEAVSALDVSVQAQVLDLLDDIREKYNLAMLFITHDLRVAAQICDRLIVMQNGLVVEEGATHHVYAHPQQEYTQQLLDAAPGADVAFGLAR